MEHNIMPQNEGPTSNLVSNIPPQPQVIITRKENLLWIVVGRVISLLLYVFFMVWSFWCIKREWYLLLMAFSGALFSTFLTYKHRDIIAKQINNVKNIPWRTLKRFIYAVFILLLVLLLASCVVLAFSKNVNSKLAGGICLHVFGAIILSILTYIANRKK